MEFISTEEYFYIFEELCIGLNVAELLEYKGKLSEAEALSILRPLVNAVKCLHDKNVIHRDLKL